MRIYIIDDEDVSNFILKALLVKEGIARDHEVKVFRNSEEALSALGSCSADQYPEKIFLDLNMPGMDGWELLEHLSAMKERIAEIGKLYILTSSLAPSDERRAKEHPMISGFFRKPIATEDVRGLK